MIVIDFNEDKPLNTIENGDKFSLTKNKTDEITNVLSAELPKGYDFMYFT